MILPAHFIHMLSHLSPIFPIPLPMLWGSRLAECCPSSPHLLEPETEQAILALPERVDNYRGSVVAKLNKVSIRYGTRTILKNLCLTVRNGDCWALGGENGAGKSTFLSLICADNPQSYACDIELRGSGESIWDIKSI